MREIKFRAWYANKKMHYDISPIDNRRYIVFETKNKNAHDLHINRAVSIMQYTGLKDKNGREIYEGDIIECLHEGNGFVTKRHGAYGIETRFGFYPFIEIYGEAEVIGNVYENPELLKEGEE